MIYLDTHVVAWLYEGVTDLLPPQTRALLEENRLLVSPIVGLELQYLFEIGRTAVEAPVVLEALSREIDLEVCDLPFAEVVRQAWSETWTRDPFDRLIVSQARRRGAPLITRDAVIAEHYEGAIWGTDAGSRDSLRDTGP